MAWRRRARNDSSDAAGLTRYEKNSLDRIKSIAEADVPATEDDAAEIEARIRRMFYGKKVEDVDADDFNWDPRTTTD